MLWPPKEIRFLTLKSQSSSELIQRNVSLTINPFWWGFPETFLGQENLHLGRGCFLITLEINF